MELSRYHRQFKRTAFNFIRALNLSKVRALVACFRLLVTRDPGKRVLILSTALSQTGRIPLSKLLFATAIRNARVVNSGRTRESGINLKYSILVKPHVSDREKGLLLVSFEHELDKLLSHRARDSILEKYNVIFLPSWTGLYSPPLLELIAISQSTHFVLPVHAAERELCDYLGGVAPLPFNAASWVKENLYVDSKQERDIPCLMVANFSTYKRHFLLFKALKDLPDSIHATCVGVPLGKRTRASLEAEAREYGVLDKVTIVESPSDEELRSYLRRARVFCGLSYREGSYIAVAEALMSGTPVIMFRNAQVGTKELINPITGTLVGSTRDLRDAIIRYQREQDHDAIRNCALEQVGASRNVARLNATLKQIAENNKLPWTRDVSAFFSMKLSFHYWLPEDRVALEPDYAELANMGVEFAASPRTRVALEGEVLSETA